MNVSNRLFATAVAALVAAGCGAETEGAAVREGAEMASGRAVVAGTKVMVYKAPTCGCCNEWVTHLRSMGFEVETEDTDDVQRVKAEHGVPFQLQSCHTALVDGYVIEGHVPGDVIARLLEERPDVRGLAVPGMPVGSPGMEMGDRKDPYDVIAFDGSGTTRVYESR